MRALIAVIVIAIVAFFAVPMVAEGTTNTCQALEKHSVSNTAAKIAGGTSGPVYGVINGVGQAGATGQVANTTAQENNPNTPSPISCTVSYWQQIL